MDTRSESGNENSGFLRILQVLGSLSAALVAFGYLSLRTHLNRIGVGSSVSLGVDRYLMEIPEILATVLAAAIPFGFIAAVAAIASVAYRRFRPSSPHSFARVDRWASTDRAPATLAVLLLATAWFTFGFMVSADRGDLAVGDLADKSRPGEGWAFYILLYALACLSLASYYLKRTSREQTPRSRLWVLPQALIAILALQLPVLYGSEMHDSHYVKTKLVRVAGAAPPETVCGLLVLETPSLLHVWSANANFGVIRVLSRSEIHGQVTGEAADLWKIARQAAKQATVSLCPAGAQ